MRLTPITRYRPARTSDGEGGFLEASIVPYECFGALVFHKAQLVLAIDRDEDVKVGDWISVADEQQTDEEAYYRVTAIDQASRGMMRGLQLERMARPIWPLAVDYLTFEGERMVFGGEFVTVRNV